MISTTESKKQKPKQTEQTRTGTESQNVRSHGGLSTGKGGGKMREKVQRIRSITGRYKIDRGKLRIV